MSNAISQYGRIAATDIASRANLEKADKRNAKADASSAELGRSNAPVAAEQDQVLLSETARQAMAAPEFDRAKVEAIKQAIQEGQYPLDSRRIAESFMAIEQMIKG